jgi:hypothetical protein
VTFRDLGIGDCFMMEGVADAGVVYRKINGKEYGWAEPDLEHQSARYQARPGTRVRRLAGVR